MAKPRGKQSHFENEVSRATGESRRTVRDRGFRVIRLTNHSPGLCRRNPN